RAGAGGDPEVGILHLQRHRAAAQLPFGDLRPDDVYDVVERLAQRAAARQVLEEGALAAERLADAVGAHGPEVDAAGGAVEIVGEAAEVLAEERDVLRGEVRPRFDAEPRHLLAAARPDAVEAANRQPGDKGGAFAGADHAEAVGLVLVAGQLGEELVVADPGAGGEAGFLADARADHLGDAR